MHDGLAAARDSVRDRVLCVSSLSARTGLQYATLFRRGRLNRDVERLTDSLLGFSEICGSRAWQSLQTCTFNQIGLQCMNLAVSINWGCFAGVLKMMALLLGVYSRTAHVWKLLLA